MAGLAQTKEGAAHRCLYHNALLVSAAMYVAESHKPSVEGSHQKLTFWNQHKDP